MIRGQNLIRRVVVSFNETCSWYDSTDFEVTVSSFDLSGLLFGISIHLSIHFVNLVVSIVLICSQERRNNDDAVFSEMLQRIGIHGIIQSYGIHSITSWHSRWSRQF